MSSVAQLNSAAGNGDTSIKGTQRAKEEAK
jgi:hypothetical protein